MEQFRRYFSAVLISVAVFTLFSVFPIEAPSEEKVPDETKETMVDKQAEKIDFRADGSVVIEKNAPEPVLKKIDLNRIGAAPSYETFEGQRLGPYFPMKYFTVAQRVEIYQEPKPIDAHILDAMAIRYLNSGTLRQAARGGYWIHWDKAVEFRSQLAPMFTRAYGTEITMSMPNNKEIMIRYTKDYRDIYNQQTPKYLQPYDVVAAPPFPYINNNINYDHEQWDQNEILIMHSKFLPCIMWNYTLNVGYRYSTLNAKNDVNYYSNRHTYISSLSLAPRDDLEFFGQFEYFKDKRPRCTFVYSPDHYFYAGEVRMKFDQGRTAFIPRVSYSIDRYMPFYNRFKKWEIQARLGRDFTPKFNATTNARYVLAMRQDVDNTAPSYAAPNPINQSAAWVGSENRVQYNIFHKFWLQGGVDYSAGLNMCDFDNISYLGGLEFYAPGLLRVDVGWRGNQYYNIDDFISSVYFKVYLFM